MEVKREFHGMRPHTWVTDQVDENGDRVRTLQDCVCGARRMVTFAKRLDDHGWTAWGPPGEWVESERWHADDP